MDLSPAEQFSPEAEAQAHNLKHEAAAALGRTTQEIELGNLPRYLRGSRFLKGFTRQTDARPAGFFKMSADATLADADTVRESEERIRREWRGTQLANTLGIPSVEILTDCTETTGKKRILELQQIDPNSGTFILAEFVKKTDPQYGKKAALALMAASGKEIPPEVSIEGVNDGDWRNKSLETLLVVWHESDKIFDPQYAEEVAKGINPEKLKHIADTVRSELQAIIPQQETPERRFFVHNDAAPNNMFFQDATVTKEEQTLLLDFEQSGCSHNRFSAQLTDMGGFYGRAWANKDMQQAFIQGIMEAPTPDSAAYKYQLAKSSIVFGTVFLAKYGIDPEHPEHTMTQSLLRNLEDNLAFLETLHTPQPTDSVSEPPLQ